MQSEKLRISINDTQEELLSKITWRGCKISELSRDELLLVVFELMKMDAAINDPSLSAGSLKTELTEMFFQV